MRQKEITLLTWLYASWRIWK